MNMHSYHIFLFTFKWKGTELGESLINNSGKTEKRTWSRDTSQDSISSYNEHKFFHEFAHPAIFSKEKKSLLEQFSYEIPNDLKYIIKVKRRKPLIEVESLFNNSIPEPPKRYDFDEGEQTYALSIDKITLNLYEQNIGILSFHLINNKYKDPEDILLINQFGRRIFPPFFDKHFNNFDISDIKNPVGGTIHRELPISIQIEGTGINAVEDFEENFKETKNINTGDYIPAHIYFFLGTNIDLFKITNILDDRMFVMCWYGAEQISYKYRIKRLKAKDEKKDKVYILSDLCQRMRGGYEVSGFYRDDLQHRSLALNQTHDSYGYACNDFWYQYVFIDGYSSSCANSKVRSEQIEKHTYSRWVEANTLYGVSRYSFVCLTEPKINLETPFPNAGFIIDHIQTIYFRMVSLVLAQRAMILKYSFEATEISKFLKINSRGVLSKENRHKLRLMNEKLEDLFKDYTYFVNRVFFREITAQEQGIELYDMLLDHLRIEKQAKELEHDLDEMFRISNIKSADQTNKQILIITILGGIIVVPNFILTLLSNRFFINLPALQNIFDGKPMFDSIALIFAIAICAFLITFGLLSYNTKIFPIKRLKTRKWAFTGKWLVIIALIILLIYLSIFQFFIDKTF